MKWTDDRSYDVPMADRTDDELAAHYEVPENREPVGPGYRLPRRPSRRIGPVTLTGTPNRRRLYVRWEGRFVIIWASIRRPPGADD